MKILPVLCLFLLAAFGASNILMANTRAILIENDTNDSMSFETNARDMELKHRIPEHARAKFIMQINHIHDAIQGELLTAIINDSVINVVNALQSGANMNLRVNGRSPLQWAILLKSANVSRYLVQNGAVL